MRPLAALYRVIFGSDTDPALRQSRISGTFDVHDYRVRYQISNLGTLKTRGSSLQFGIPAFGWGRKGRKEPTP